MTTRNCWLPYPCNVRWELLSLLTALGPALLAVSFPGMGKLATQQHTSIQTCSRGAPASHRERCRPCRPAVPGTKTLLTMVTCCAGRWMRRFVYCRQRTDERLRRGSEQKSVVVLAAQPHSSVLRPLSQHAGALYFNRGPAALAEVGMIMRCTPTHASLHDSRAPHCCKRTVCMPGSMHFYASALCTFRR